MQQHVHDDARDAGEEQDRRNAPRLAIEPFVPRFGADQLFRLGR
jgi:hypothetical protein